MATGPEHDTSMPLLGAGAPRGGRESIIRLVLWCGWLAAAGFLALHHVVWRDEVRALTLALSGDSVAQMLWAIHGEGHPALWYLLLRGGYAIAGVPQVLPAIAFVIAAAATALIAARAPFRPLIIALVLFGAYALVDYAVVARNYGLSMLLMAAIADRYPSTRDRGVTLGVLLFLLGNSNAPAVMLAGGFLLFWAIELLLEQGWRWTPALRNLATNAAIAAAGVVACAAVVYPPFNDAASLAAGGDGVLPFARLSAGLSQTWPGATLFALLLLGSLVGLARAPAAFAAAMAVTAAASLFFAFVYPGFYRHQALVLVFLLCLHWLALKGRGGRWPDGIATRWRATLAAAQRYGAMAFVGLLALQTATGLALFAQTARGEPFSRSRDLGRLLHAPALRRAVVIGNPDVMLEPLSYYADNPIWFVREHRWGRVVALTRAAMRDLSLGEMLATARRLRAATGRPVVIVLVRPLDPAARASRWDQDCLGGFTTTPAEVVAFLAATRRLARFGPAQTDERYDVYLLR